MRRAGILLLALLTACVERGADGVAHSDVADAFTASCTAEGGTIVRSLRVNSSVYTPYPDLTCVPAGLAVRVGQ